MGFSLVVFSSHIHEALLVFFLPHFSHQKFFLTTSKHSNNFCLHHIFPSLYDSHCRLFRFDELALNPPSLFGPIPYTVKSINLYFSVFSQASQTTQPYFVLFFHVQQYSRYLPLTFVSSQHYKSTQKFSELSRRPFLSIFRATLLTAI